MAASFEWSAKTRRPDERLPVRGAACVIEPNDEARDHIAALLRAMGFVTHETGCGLQGAFIASQVRLEAVVVDLSLPDMKGLTLVRRLRRDDADLTIIALSPDSMMALLSTLGRFVGADAVLAMPVGDEALCRALAEAAHRGRASLTDVVAASASRARGELKPV